MGIILPFGFVVVKLEGFACGRLVDKSGLGGLRSVLRADLAQTVQLRLRADQLVTQQRLAADELRHLAVDLLHLLDHHLAQQLLTQLGDSHDRTRTLATLVGGDLVHAVVALAVHAISIGYGAPNASPLTRFLGRFVRPISVITQ